jgi:putative ABC transport system ATP-binding protein
VLEVVDISKVFNPGTPNEVRALEHVNYTLPEGGFLAVVGTNGSGKSTFLNAVAGTFFVSEGRILLDGRNITRLPEHRRARFVGRVFQNPFSGTAADMSIAENLALAAGRAHSRGLGWLLGPGARQEIRARVTALNMGLEDRLDDSIGGLSGGQRQALTLLMATWTRPRLLLLDEHTAALDPKTASLVVQLSREIIAKDRLTTLMVTHSMQQAIALGDRILMMHRGRVIHDFQGQDKQGLRVADMLALFDEVRRKDQIDPTTVEMLERSYV